MISTSTALAILGACLPLALGALNKPVINPPFPNGLSSLNNGLTANYPMTGYTQATLDSSQTPQWCKDAASSNGKSQNFFIYAVKYNDCGSTWIMCHHADAPSAQQSLAENFGRIPVQMRSYIRYLASFPGGNSAFNQGNNIAFFGTTPQSISVHIHEVGHSIDSEAYSDGHPFHDTSTWLNAYNADSAVADSYAQTSQAENHSQELVVAMYDKRVPGGIASANSGYQQIRNQYSIIQNRLGNKIVPGGSCAARLANEARVRVPIQGATFEPKTAPDAPYVVDIFDDEGNFRGTKEPTRLVRSAKMRF